MTTRAPNLTDAFDDPTPDPYPELEEEVHEMYFKGGTSIASLSVGEDLEAYREWLGGLRPLFFGKPERWSFRGDTYLWDALEQHLASADRPATLSGLERLIQASFLQLTGAKLSEDGALVLEQFAHGGMSSGGICREFWRQSLVPELVRRYRRACVLLAQSCIVNEADFDIALENAFLVSNRFKEWFLFVSSIESADLDVVWSRSNSPWTTVDHPLPGGGSVPRQGETDVLIVLEGGDGRRLGLHIENKLPGRAFQPHQAEGYRLRAAKWVGQPAYGRYDSWKTVLIAPLKVRGHQQAMTFDCFVAYEQVLEHLQSEAFTADLDPTHSL